MRPAFTSLTVMNHGKKLKVQGPIDLDGREYEAYIWVRVTQSAKDGNPKAEGIGTAEGDRDALKAEYNKASERLLANVKALPGAPSGVKKKDVVQAVDTATAMWDATIKATEGTFRAGELARVEAWALVRARSPTREFHVYWRENGVMVT